MFFPIERKMLFAAERKEGAIRKRTSANAPPSRRIASGSQTLFLSLGLSERVLVRCEARLRQQREHRLVLTSTRTTAKYLLTPFYAIEKKL